jgi:phage terminase large subunit GpA-like protein
MNLALIEQTRRAALETCKGVSRHLIPVTQPEIVQWARDNCYLSGITEMPGYYSTSLFPYAERILRCIQDPKIKKISLKFGSQSSKTTIIYIALAYLLANKPSPAMWVMPSQAKAKRFSTVRWKPLWMQSPTLRALLPSLQSGGVDMEQFANLEQTINGAPLCFVGAGSDANVKSDPVTYLVLDEIDEIPSFTRRQALERVKGRHRYKILQASTPKGEHDGIEDEYQLGTKEHYHIECPCCKKAVPIYWRDNANQYLIKHDPNAVKDGVVNHRLLAESAYYEMPCCGHHLKDGEKAQALRNGKKHHNEGWLATNEHPEEGHVSFFLPSQYSNIVTFGTMLSEFYKHLNDPAALPAFVMGWLAEPWKEKIIEALPDQLKRCIGDYDKGAIKGDVRVIAVDVQRTDLVYNVRGYDKEGSYLLEQGRCEGFDFVKQLQDKYEAEHVGIDYAFPDRKQEVFTAVHRNRGEGWFALRAFDKMSKPFEVKRTDPFLGTSKQSKFRLNSIMLFHLDTNLWKGVLSTKRNGEDTRWQVYKGIEKSYERELYAEFQKEIQDGKGRKRFEWRVKGHGQNHQFDLETYHLAIAQWLGIGHKVTGGIKKEIAQVLERMTQKDTTEPEQPKEEDPNPEQPKRKISIVTSASRRF